MSHLELLWPAPPAHRRLGGQDVHVWAFDLNQSPKRISSFTETLSPDEHDRAARFRFERDRHRFIAGRGILREILGSYLNTLPSQLHFLYTARGKPCLADGHDSPALHFNLAHSENLILLAVTRARPIGVDVEWIHPIPDMENILRQYFSTSEITEVMALPEDRQSRAFFTLWTRKEACLKATGEGLLDSVSPIDVAFPAATWTLVNLNPALEYVAAVAVPTRGLALSNWQWPSEKLSR